MNSASCGAQSLKEALKNNQYNGPLSARGIIEGSNLSIRNSYRLMKSAELLFANGDYAGAIAFAILAFEENGKYITLFNLYNRESGLARAWEKVRMHTCKTKRLIALVSLLRLLKESQLSPESISPEMDRNADISDFLDALKQRALYCECVGENQWRFPPEIMTKEFAAIIMALLQ